CRIPAARSRCRPLRRNEARSASVTVTGMLGPPAASIPRHGDGEPDRRGGQRQLDQDRLPHPLRQEILGHLSEHAAASSTPIAEALGQNIGTTSYHLRVLADAGIIEEVTERAPAGSGGAARSRSTCVSPITTALARRTVPRWTSDGPGGSPASSPW